MKKRFIMLLILATCFLVGISYAVWVITSEKAVSPNYDPLSYIKYELDNKTTTYNGSNQFPSTANLSGVESNSDYTITYDYKGFADLSFEPYTTGLPKNAGSYKIYVSYKGKSITLNYTINKLTYDLSGVSIADATYDYDGSPKSITISGTLPTGVSVQYKYNNVVAASATNAGVYTVVAEFNGDFTNYETLTSKSATLTINKIYDPAYVALTSLNAIAGQSLSNITLPNGFSWYEAASTPVGSEGSHTFHVNYTPSDTINYITITNIPVTVYVSGSSVSKLVIIATNNLSNTYNANSQYPASSIVDSLNNTISSSEYTLTYQYKLSSASSYTTGYPVNAGIYNIKISCVSNNALYEDADELVLTYTINKKIIEFNQPVLGIDYDYSNRTWSLLSALIKSNVTLNGVIDGDSCDFTINGMHNGKYKYGTVTGSYTAPTSDSIFGSSYTNVIGSTYQVFVNLTNNNYELEDTSLILKYKTAVISSTYYTIEDALATTGTITFAGDTTSTTTYVATTFTSLPTSITGYSSNSSFSLNNRTLIVPYSNNSTTQKEDQVTVNSGNVCSSLIIPNTITLNLSGTAIICAAGKIGAIGGGKCSISTDRGVIVNNGTINAASGTSVMAYGFIKGTGLINLQSGSKGNDCLCSYDWPGGTAAASFYSSAFVTNSYSVHNNSCPTYIYAGAEYYGYLLANISSSAKTANVSLIAKSTGSNCLFKAEDTSGYIYKTVSNGNALCSITSSNQTVSYNDCFEIMGNYKDGVVSVSITLIIKVTISTGTSKPTPIGLINITVKSGSVLTISSSDYLFLPGSSLTIEEGATVKVTSSSVDLTFATASEIQTYGKGGNKLFTSNTLSNNHNDAYLLCNGTLECAGSIGGKIITSGENATVKLTNKTTSSYVCMYSTSSPYYFSATSQAKINMYGATGVNSSLSNVAAGTYYSIKDVNNKYGFYSTSGTISFNSNGGVGSFANINITIPSGGYEITNNDINGKVPTRSNYNFEGWYTDSTFSTPAIGSFVYCGIELIAKWTPIQYNIIYNDIYHDNFSNGNTSVYNNPSVFTYETNIALNEPANNNYVFAGWYLDSTCSNKINNINGSTLVNYLVNNNVNIYALWYPAGTEKYIIYYNNSNPDVPCISSDTLVVENTFIWSNYRLPDMSLNDNNFEALKYFDGWYNNGVKVNYVNDSMFNYDSNVGAYVLTLNSQWINKTKLDVNVEGLGTITSVYYKPGCTFTVPTLASMNRQLGQGLVLINWVLGDLVVNCGDTVTLNTQTTLIANITSYVKFEIGTNTYTNVVVTCPVGNGYIVNIDSYGYAIAVPFSGNNYSNGDDFYITKDSSFYAKFVIVSGTSNGASISGTTSTEDLTETDALYTVGTSDIEITIVGQASSCIVEGTMITLADGTQIAVEELTGNELLLVWNFLTGTYDVVPIVFIDKDTEQLFKVINLYFSDGAYVGVVSEHGFFDIDLAKYVYIDEYNYNEYIGHHFVKEDGSIVTLDNVTIEQQVIATYSPVTFSHLCYYVNGMLSMPGGISGLFNIFDVDTTSMKYDEEQMANDLATYGALSFEDYLDMITLDMYYAFNGEWLNVAIGKGLITWEDIEYLALRYGPLCE